MTKVLSTTSAGLLIGAEEAATPEGSQVAALPHLRHSSGLPLEVHALHLVELKVSHVAYIDCCMHQMLHKSSVHVSSLLSTGLD